MSDTCCRQVRSSPHSAIRSVLSIWGHRALELVPVQERLSDAAAPRAHLTVNLQPLVQEDTTPVVSSGTEGLGEDCVGCPVALDKAFPNQAHGLESV